MKHVILSGTAVVIMSLLLFGCAPEPTETAGEVVPPEIVDAPPLPPSDSEAGSRPKRDGEAAPFGGAELPGGEIAQESSGDVDRSITEDVEFGDDALLADLAPGGFEQSGNIEHYNVATLYNKINGRSELYMEYDVNGLSWVSFVREGDSNDFLDLFLYEMGSPTNAFGIYSVERESGQEPAGFGRESYTTGSNYYFWKGNYYGYINASADNAMNAEAGRQILTVLMERIPDSGEAVAGLDWLPEEDRIDDTVQYFKANAMSLDFLTDTFTAMYEFGDLTARAFVTKRPREDEAGEIVEKFREYSAEYGESVAVETIEETEVVFADWGGGMHDLIFQAGETVAGFTNVQGKDNALKAAAELITRLQD